MTLDNDLEILQQVELLKDFSREQLRTLAISSEKREFSDHASVFQDGSTAEGGYIVLTGIVAKVVQGQVGPRIVERLVPGTLIDEYALIAATQRQTAAIAIGKVELLVVRRELFRRVVSEDPHLAALVHRRWSLQLKETTKEFSKVGGKLSPTDMSLNGQSKSRDVSD